MTIIFKDEVFEDRGKTVFFGHSVIYLENVEQERQDAEDYLKLWKKYLLNSLEVKMKGYVFAGDQWVTRESKYLGVFVDDFASIGLKVWFEKKLPFQIGSNGVER